MSKNSITDRQFIRTMYKDMFEEYNEKEFNDFFSEVIKKRDSGCSLSQAFYYCALYKNAERINEEFKKHETKD